MRQINLQEYERSQPIALSSEELETLISLRNGEKDRQGRLLAIEPAEGVPGSYTLRPDSTVGALEFENFSLLIRPKIGIPQLFSLVCYAIGLFRQQDRRLFNFEQQEALPDTLALALAAAARRAFGRGLLHGYIEEEESLYTVRGRIWFDEQLRRRFNVLLPVEVRYDEFTDDIMANRLVKAAVHRLGRLTLRSSQARLGLGWVAGMLGKVSLAEFVARDVPDVKFDRLNEHYRDVVGLSRLVLKHSAFESHRGSVRANGFLMDMNQVFQEFVTTALREFLQASDKAFGEKYIESLDNRGSIRLRPDLTWWECGECRFVGDAKYKRVIDNRIPNSDLYQLLAYVTAPNLPGGMLIYAQDEDVTPAQYRVRNSGKMLEVVALDLSGSLEDVLERISVLADKVRSLRDQSRQVRRTA